MKYSILGGTGMKVSRVALGAANFGTGWGHGADEAESRSILDAYLERGGNFIDTADIYQFGQSEVYLGKFLLGRRDEIILSTKFSNGSSPNAGLLATGNSRKAMVTSLEASLKRLQTDYVDLYWVHHPDGLTPGEEILRGLEDLTQAGKILYAGLSNFPAWRVAHITTLAKVRGRAPITAVQFEYSLVCRDADIDLIPASAALAISPIVWSPLGGGVLTGKYRHGEKGRAEALGGKVFQAEDSARRTAILDAVLTIASDMGVSADQVAIAWVLSRNLNPLIGPRSLAQFQSNIAALDLTLTPDQLALLDALSAPDSRSGASSAVAQRTGDLQAPVVQVA